MNKTSIKSSLGYFLLFLGVQLGISLAVTWTATFAYIGKSPQGDATQFLLDFTAANTMWILALTSVVTIALLFVIAKRGKFSLLKDSGFSGKLSIPMFFAAAIAGVCANVWMSLVMSALPLPAEVLENYAQASANLDTGISLAALLAVGLLAPICEEFIFRGMILGRLSKEYSIFVSILLQGVLFGVVHGDALWIAYACILGCILGYVRVCTGSLKSAMAFHIAFNLASFGIILLDGRSQAVLLTTLFLSAGMFVLSMLSISKHKSHIS